MIQPVAGRYFFRNVLRSFNAPGLLVVIGSSTRVVIMSSSVCVVAVLALFAAGGSTGPGSVLYSGLNSAFAAGGAGCEATGLTETSPVRALANAIKRARRSASDIAIKSWRAPPLRSAVTARKDEHHNQRARACKTVIYDQHKTPNPNRAGQNMV